MTHDSQTRMINVVENLASWLFYKLPKKCPHMTICLQISQNESIKTHQCPFLSSQRSSNTVCSSSHRVSVLQHQNPPRHACSQTNGATPSQTDRSTLQRVLGWPSCSFSDIQTFMFAESGGDSCTHSGTRTQTRSVTLPRDLWLEPAALTQQHINHWALSSTAGPQCHAELDSTGIKIRNWIQKLIQARDNCWHTEALEVVIPPCDDTPSLSRDL